MMPVMQGLNGTGQDSIDKETDQLFSMIESNIEEQERSRWWARRAG